ncbi:AAA family ATPase [Glycocaulis albus]|uniref:AAA family ATPase n=1 Tax=Glycocaulis albus TaxID=1382801 RepID=UPI00166D23C2|nr:AAA family ATPase [Glycocaulis albus]
MDGSETRLFPVRSELLPNSGKYMLRRLKISRFKSIYESEISFGKINLFIGPNGAGKSNLLEALAILSSCLKRGVEPQDLDYKGVRLSRANLFKSSFRGVDRPKTFMIEADFDTFKYRVVLRSGQYSDYLEFFSESFEIDGVRRLGRSHAGVRIHPESIEIDSSRSFSIPSTRGLWDSLSQIIKMPTSVRKEIDDFADFAIYTPQTAVMRGLATDGRVVEPLGLTGSRLAAAFTETVRHARSQEGIEAEKRFQKLLAVIWSPGWSDLLRVGSRDPGIVPEQMKTESEVIYFRDKYMKTNANFLSPFDASEGTLYLLFSALLLAHPKSPRSFAVDNVDGTLNPGLVSKLVSHIVSSIDDVSNSSSKQVFLTSHNPTALDALDIFDTDHKIFVISRNESVSPQNNNSISGETLIRPIVPPPNAKPEDWHRRARGRNLSELLLGGEIKGALG